MSRIGKIPLVVPKDVKVNITPTLVQMEGTKGKLETPILQGLKIEQKDGQLIISKLSEAKQARANHGTMRALVKNMVQGVTKGHQKVLEVVGLGFRAQVSGQKLTMNLGFSHPVDFMVPAGIAVEVTKNNEIKLSSMDKVAVGLIAAKIRDIKKPEPYKGKGIRYQGEVVRRKQGKSVTK